MSLFGIAKFYLCRIINSNTVKHSFTAIDFETAQGKRCSICQVGLVRVENGVITKEISFLVQPPGNYYWKWFTNDIHGISPEDTANEPTFDKLWHIIEPYITNQCVVAHNGFSFDFNVLGKTLEYYGLQVPEYEKHCTCNIFDRKALNTLCDAFNIPLNHHEALSDARACAQLFLIHLLRQ